MSKTTEHKIDSAEETINIDADYDPVQAEIIRRRLYNIAQEMGTVMIRTSGDPVISEAVDFSTFIADPKGEIVSFSGYMTFHSGPARVAVNHILENVPEENINPGDQFICNDPHTTGACHPPDVGIVKPIFYGDELIAWCWAEAHLIDVGGVAPGGFAPHAQEAYAEALRWPGVKIVEGGEIIDDIKRLHNNNVRVPFMVFNDIRALIAANNRCDERLQNTINEFGLDTYNHYSEVNRELTRAAFERRIGELPDGTYSTTEYVEHDGHNNDLYELPIEVDIEADAMTIDFSGAAEQAPGFINLSQGGTLGAAMTPLMLTLAPDIPFNEGFYDQVEFVTPEGTIVNPELPAPVSSGHMEAGMHIAKGLVVVLSRAMSQSDSQFVREHAMAPFHDTWPMATFYGENQYGEPDVFLDMDGGGAGGGAQTVHDGMDTSATFTQLSNGLPDIEINEDEHPMLYLWRRIRSDSGGPGEYRGGQGHEYAWTLHNVEGGQETVTSATTQKPTEGVLGGYAGSTTVFEMLHNSDVDAFFEDGDIPASLEEMNGEHKQLPAKSAEIPVEANVVFANRQGAGSGLGDPLERDPAMVADDVNDGYLSAAAVEDVYGVVLENDHIDEEATASRREELREERTGWSTDTELDIDIEDPSHEGTFHRYVNVVAEDNEEYLACGSCETVFAPFEGPDDETWLEYTATNQSPVEQRFADLHLFVQERETEPGIEMVEHACPNCGVMFRTEITPS
jgi:N-methylhydantoinase B